MQRISPAQKFHPVLLDPDPNLPREKLCLVDTFKHRVLVNFHARIIREVALASQRDSKLISATRESERLR